MEKTPTKLPLIKGRSTYKMVIPAEVERQIRFLCERVWDTEWSGVLFYNYNGNLEDGSLKITCVDIYPMDIGSSTYTEFNMSPDVISYMTSKPELLDCKMGLIHSHNNMSTFFSGTDQNTLQEEGAERNHFVSLIVNNAGKYTAGITRKIKYKKSITYSYESFSGIVDVPTPAESEGEAIEWFELNIEIQGEPNDEMKLISNRLDEIKKNKPKAYNKWENFLNPNALTTPSTKNPIKTYTSDEKATMPSLFRDYEETDNYDYWKGRANKNSSHMSSFENFKKEDKKEEKILFSTDKVETEQQVIDSIIAQLLSGSVAVTSCNKVNDPKWIKTMTALFDKRFGEDPDGSLMFQFWAEDFIQFLLLYSVDDDGSKDPDILTAQLAEAVIEKLSEFPTNKYIDKYIDILAGFMQ